jgi:ribokinase
VVVAGGINIDLIANVAERPIPGGTVHAQSLQRRPGGKGANIAAAVARAGCPVRMIGAVGEDREGAELVAELRRGGVDVGEVEVVAGTATGVAFVTVTPDGENSIIVAGGANRSLVADRIVRIVETSAPGTIVVLQTEIPASVIDAAARACDHAGGRLVLSVGPVQAVAPATGAVADPLVLNAHEADEICGGVTEPDIAQAVRAVTRARSVVVTLGGDGAVLADGEASVALPAVAAARVVDTIGAGDAFVGSLAAALASHDSLRGAVEQASLAAGITVGWMGARPPAELRPGSPLRTCPHLRSTARLGERTGHVPGNDGLVSATGRDDSAGGR